MNNVGGNGLGPGRRWVRILSGLIAAAVASALMLVPAASASAASSGEVFVIQGISGQVLDVLVDNKNVRPMAEFKTIVGPLQLKPGKHLIAVKSGSTVVAKGTVRVRAGNSIDAIVHSQADASMAPELTIFTNNLAPVAPGRVRLSVAHTAAAPPADIRVDGEVLFRNIANGEALWLVVPAKTYSVEIVPSASAGAAILGPVSLTLKAGTFTRVYGVGSVANGSMDAVVHAVPVPVVGAAAPRSVATGDGGQAAAAFARSGVPAPILGLALALTLVAILGVGRRMRRSVRSPTAQ
jgi:hypothetical protein